MSSQSQQIEPVRENRKTHDSTTTLPKIALKDSKTSNKLVKAIKNFQTFFRMEVC